MQAALSTTEASVRKDLAHSGSQAQPSLLSLRTATRHPDQALQDAALVLEAAQGVLSGAPWTSTVCFTSHQGTVAWQHAGFLRAQQQHQTTNTACKRKRRPTGQACT